MDGKYLGAEYDVRNRLTIFGGDTYSHTYDVEKTACHATMISYITSTDIKYTGHTDPAFGKNLLDNLRNSSVVIVRFNNYF